MAKDLELESEIAEVAEVPGDVPQAEEKENCIVIHLRKPLANGIDTLTLDFHRVNGGNLILIEKAARKEDRELTVPALSSIYQAMVAARAAGMHYDAILKLSGKDFTAVCLKVQNFLLG